jgi:hypothetical protein
MALTDNLLAFYKLNDLTDSSGNNRTLTNNGNVSFASGKLGNAAVLNNGSLSLNAAPLFSNISELTISCWYKNSVNYAIFSIWAGGSNDFSIVNGWGDDGSQIGMGFFTNSGGGYYSFGQNTKVPNDGNYHHLVMQYSSSASSFKFYKDGELIFSTSISGALATSQNLSKFIIGAQSDGINNGSGSFDAFGIWNRALSDPEIANLYNSGTGLELSKTGWYDAEELYYINGTATTLDSSGDGTWNSLRYSGGTLFTGTENNVSYVQGVSVSTIKNNLLAFYKLDDLTDSSGNNRTLTNNGNAAFASGKLGNAVTTNSSSYITGPLNILPNNPSGFTVSLWAKGSDSIGKGWSTPFYMEKNGMYYGIGMRGTQFEFHPATNGNNNSLVLDENESSGVWVHVVLVIDSSNNAKAFRNGVLKKTGPAGSLLSGQLNQHYIGGNIWSPGYWGGSVDAVGIWNRALSDQEIAALYNSGTGLELTVKNGWYADESLYYINDTATTFDSSGNGTWNGVEYVQGVSISAIKTNLLAFYKLDDLTDSSGNNRTLTNNGNVSFASGKLGNAASLASGTLSTESLNFNGLNAMSMSMWVKVDGNNSGSWCFASRFSDYNGGQLFFGNNPDNSSLLRLILNVNGNFYNIQTSDHNVYDGNWHFVTFSFNGQQIKMYVDSQLKGTQNASGNISNSSAAFKIGGSVQEIYSTAPFNGLVDALGIWNHALSDAEIAALYNSGTGLELTVKNGWYANESLYYINDTATTLDSSGNGTWNSLRYSGGALFTGTVDGDYYVSGALANGTYNNIYYVNGNPATGTYNGLYYSNGTLFTGTFEGIDYISGKTIYHFTNTVDDSFNTLGNWYLDAALTIPAPNIPPSGSHVKVSPSCTSTNLAFGSRGLASLNVSGCTSLQYLYCHINQLTSLNVSGCTSLQILQCNNNQLTSLDVSGLTSLITLYCDNNQLTSLNVSGFTSLQYLYCHINQLTSLDVSGCTSLIQLYCYNNQLTSLDVSGLTSLLEFYIFSNQLNEESLNSIFTDLRVASGGNLRIWNNPGSLICASAIATSKNWAVLIIDPNAGGGSSGSGSGSGSESGSGDVGAGLGNILEFLNGKYYINGVATTLNENGNGWWRGRRYSGGSLVNNLYYSNGYIPPTPSTFYQIDEENLSYALSLGIQQVVYSMIITGQFERDDNSAFFISASEEEKKALVPNYNENNLILAYNFSPNVTFNGIATITFTIPENFSQDVFNRCKIYHVKTDNTVEELSRVSSNLAAREIVVSVNSFSDFVIMDNPPAATSLSVKIEGKTKFSGNVKFA